LFFIFVYGEKCYVNGKKGSYCRNSSPGGYFNLLEYKESASLSGNTFFIALSLAASPDTGS
jgi:hypothetical protein